MEDLLESDGFKVYRPTMTGLGERQHLNGPDVDLDTHITDIVNLILVEDLSDIILVGHSYGGMVITGVADRIPGRLKHLVYADALLPEHGESVLNTMSEEDRNWMRNHARTQGQAWDIPPYWDHWGKDVPQPLGTYEQPISLKNPKRDDVPGTFILAVEPGTEKGRFEKFADRAKQRGWPVIQLVTSHNIQRTVPDEYAQIIKDID
jgi:pimeloyl-ACP methyl ester carboxylesterase